MKLSIPDISDDALRDLAEKVKPLIRDRDDGKPYNIRACHLRDVAYTWSPRLVGDPVENLTTIGQFQCLHRYGYYGMFKPSIAEVLCQMPKELADSSEYFEIVKQPNWANDLNEEREALNAGFHVSTVRTYSTQ